MDRSTFEAALARDGFTMVSITMKPNAVNPEHAHSFDARVMVFGGGITIVRDGKAETFCAGDSYPVPAGTLHAEQAGPEGVAYLAGRRTAVG